LSKTSKGGNVTRAVWELAEPYAKELGLELWDVRFEKEGSERYLRIYIDRAEGVSIDDCVDLTHAIDEPLDALDPIKEGYTLEVSSPGVERKLTRDDHFTRCIGEKVQVRFIRPVDGERDFKGVLKDFDNGTITVETEEGKTFLFKKNEASYIKLDDFDAFC